MKTEKHREVSRLVWVRQGESINVTSVEIAFLREGLVDMVVAGEAVAQPLKSCDVLWQLSPLRPQTGAKRGEYDPPKGGSDFSLSKCGDLVEISEPFQPERMALTHPTPGIRNKCPGISLVFEKEENLAILLNDEVQRKHGVPLSYFRLSENIEKGVQLPSCSYSFHWLEHIVDTPTAIQVSWFRDREIDKRTTSTCPCALQDKTLSMQDVDHLLTDDCKTTEELLASFSGTLSNAEYIVMKLFLANMTRKLPAALVSLSEFGCWIASGQGVSEILSFVQNMHNETVDVNNSSKNTDTYHDLVLVQENQSQSPAVASARIMAGDTKNERKLYNLHSTEEEMKKRVSQKNILGQENQARQSTKVQTYSRNCKQFSNRNQFSTGYGGGGGGGGGGSGGGALAGLGGALAGFFGGLFGGLASLGGSVNSALASQASGALNTLSNLADNLADAATNMDNDLDVNNDIDPDNGGDNGENNNSENGDGNGDQDKDKNMDDDDCDCSDEDNDDDDDDDDDNDDDKSKTTVTTTATTTSLRNPTTTTTMTTSSTTMATTTTTTTTTSTTTVTTTTTMTTQPSDVCLIYPKIQRNKHMVHDEQEGNDCRCIFEKLHDEIKGDAQQYIGQCGQPTNSPDPFDDTPDDQLLPLKEIIEQDVPESAYGSPHMLDTIMVRGGLFRKDLWRDPVKLDDFLTGNYVCGKHYKELGPNWKQTPSPFNRIFRPTRGAPVPACSFPDNVEGAQSHQKAVAANRGSYTSRRNSKAMLAIKHGSFIQLGAPVCSNHKKYLNELDYEYGINRKGYRLKPKTKKPLAEGPTLSQLSAFDDEPLQLSQDYKLRLSQELPAEHAPQQPLQPIKAPNEQKVIEENVKNLLRQAANQLGVTNFYFTSDFRELRPKTKRLRVGAVQKFTDALVHLMAPDDPLELWSLLLGREKGFHWRNVWSVPQMDKLLRSVSESFHQATNKADRIHALALVAPIIPYSQLQNYFPGLSHYYFTQARKVFKRYGFAAREQKTPSGRICLGPDSLKKIDYFVGFLTLPENLVSLPFGTRMLQLSTGDQLQVPSVIRVMAKTRTINTYYKYLQHVKEKDAHGNELDLYQKYFLSRSTLERIMDACVAGTRKTVLGLDSYTYLGVEGTDNFIDLIDRTSMKFLLDKDWVANRIRSFREAKHYIKSDFKLHLKQSSHVARHCTTWALSDPDNQYFLAHSSDHEHDYKCPHCVSIQETIKEVKSEIIDKDWSADELNEIIYLLDHSEVDIEKWIAHQVRTVYQDKVRQDILENLKPGTEIFVIIDWAMKWLPKSGRETQSDWYGKRGISWHVIHVVWRPKAGMPLQTRSYIHVFDQSKQNGGDVSAILIHFLEQLKEELPSVQTAFIRSDNGPHYHQSGLMASVHTISEKNWHLYQTMELF